MICSLNNNTRNAPKIAPHQKTHPMVRAWYCVRYFNVLNIQFFYALCYAALMCCCWCVDTLINFCFHQINDYVKILKNKCRQGIHKNIERNRKSSHNNNSGDLKKNILYIRKRISTYLAMELGCMWCKILGPIRPGVSLFEKNPVSHYLRKMRHRIRLGLTP